MKRVKQMTAFDIKACVKELQSLVGGKVEKIYHHLPDEIRFRIYAGEKYDLVVEAGRRIHTTRFPRESPRFPSPFAMLLRKHLEGARIEGIEQHDFDRIVVLTFRRGEEIRRVVAELFLRGNVILLDGENRVIMPLKSGPKSGDAYSFPEPIRVGEVRDGEKEVVRAIATSGLGGLYAEEVCLRAGVNKKKRYSELSDEERERIKRAIDEIMDFELNPQIVMRAGTYIDVVPMDLLYYREFDRKRFESFNDALDDFYSKMIVESAEIEREKSKELEKLKKRLEIQRESKKKLKEDAERYRKMGDLLYEYYGEVEEVLRILAEAKEKVGWEGIKKAFEKSKGRVKNRKVRVTGINPENDSIIVEIGGERIELCLSKSIHENANALYEKSKKAREKLSGIEIAIKRTLEEMKRAEERLERKYVSSLRVRRKREWFENFRWFITSDGFLAIGGRNVKMNEEIVSRYMESRDLFFHTQTPGAPAVILKRGQDAPERSLIEAAEFAAIYSSLWKEGKHSGEVYYVLPSQVSRAAKHGEYLPRGSFYITGKRNYISVELRCAIGVEMDRMRVIGGPVTAVESRADYIVEIEIGERDANELSVEISNVLSKLAGEEKHILRAIATPDEIMKFLPPGKSRIVRAERIERIRRTEKTEKI